MYSFKSLIFTRRKKRICQDSCTILSALLMDSLETHISPISALQNIKLLTILPNFI